MKHGCSLPPSRTLHPTGKRTAHVKKTNAENMEKCGFTVIHVLAITESEEKVKPWIIFKGVRDHKIKTNRVHIAMQRIGYTDEGSTYVMIIIDFQPLYNIDMVPQVSSIV